MIRQALTLSVLAGILALAGCSSKAVHQNVVDAESEKRKSRPAVVEQKKIPFEKISDVAYQHYVNGLLYEGLGNMPKAAGSYSTALKFHPTSYDIRYSLAETYYYLRRYEQTITVLDSIHPEDADVLLLRAASLSSLERHDVAHGVYLDLIKLDPNSSMAFSQLAGYYRRHNDIDSLVWAYQNLVRNRPDNERIWRELGRLQAQTRDYVQAGESFKRSVAIRGDQTNILSYLGLAEIYLITEKDDSAVMAYQAALEVEPLNVIANRELAALMVRRDSLAAAAAYAHNVIKVSPLDRDAVRRLGVIYFGLDSLRQADSIMTWLVSSGERNSINHYYLGRIGILTKDFEKAISEFTILTQMADSVYESWLDLGYAYRKSGQHEKEILTYQTGLNHVKDEPNELKLMFAMGAAYEQNSQFSEAEVVFEEIIAKSPTHSQAMNYLGYMLADRGERLEYAKELIEKAVRLAPENAAYLDSYGWVYYRLEKFDKAVEQLKKAVTLDSDPIIFDHLGDAYNAVGDVANARIWWEKALELAPDDEKIKKKLGY